MGESEHRVPVAVRAHACRDSGTGLGIARFGGNRLAPMMSALGLAEGEEISHPMVASAVANAQRKIAGQARSDLEAATPEDWFQINVV